jgi:hypothetical protein
MSIETDDTYRKPLPRPSAESQPFWEAARQHKLMLQKCKACGKFWFPPSLRCVHCLSGDYDWTEVVGTGRVFSFVTYQRLYHKGWDGENPYVVAVVELDEGPRLLSNVVGIPVHRVACDMRVKVTFDDVTPGVSLPKFTPA